MEKLTCQERLRVYTELEDCGRPIHGDGPYCELHGRQRLLVAIERLGTLKLQAEMTRQEIESLQRRGYRSVEGETNAPW